MWKSVCCAVDFSEPSRLAMERAAALVRQLGAELALVHVHAPPPAVATDLAASREELGERTLVTLEATMAAWRAEAELRAGKAVDTVVLPGDPALEIARLAEERGFDLVVVGTHGRKGLRRLVLGSVAGRVVQEAACEVLVVR